MDFSINLYVVLALVALVAGFILMGLATLASADPEGRGGGYAVGFGVSGILLVIVGAAYNLYRLGAVFHFWS